MTAQEHENLILNGEETSMSYCPPLPENDPRIVEIDSDDRERCYTSCWREYIGTWEIKDKKFYLKGLTGKFKLTGKEPIFADWFSGVIRIPIGEILHYVHMGFGSVFEEELHVKIENGIIRKSKNISNRDKEVDSNKLTAEIIVGSRCSIDNKFDGDDKI